MSSITTEPADAAASSPSPARTAEQPITMARIVAFGVMVFGMFMAILDIQIVSASLTEIQAGLSASNSEIAWVQTAYLIAEVIMIPLSGYLARMLSTRVVFTISAAGFTIASAMAATATNIDQMIIYRAAQGFIGGGMIPSVFAAAFTIFPPSKRAIVSPIIGLIATLAPTIGPTVGGYLSHAFSWHWLFLVNVPIGILVTIFAWLLIDFDKPNLALFHKFDWWGLLGMALFLGSLEYVLEEGPANDWLQDETVRNFSIIMVIGAVLFFWRAFTSEEPIVDLKAFSDVNFAVGSLFSFTLGVGLYGLTYLYPLYLGRIRGYDSLMIGETLAVSGAVMFLSAPLSGMLTRILDLRVMLMGGFIIFAAGTWRMTYLTADWDFNELLVPQVLRGMALMLCMVPINNLSLGTLPRDRIKNASGLYNLTRNLGGAFGLAIINTMLTKRADFHYARLAETVNYANAQAVGLVDKLSRSYSSHGLDGQTAALAQLKRMVLRQAGVMTYIDVFTMLTLLFLTLAAGAMLMRKPPPEASGIEAH